MMTKRKRMDEIKTMEAYCRLFPEPEKALERAIEIRKLELELYWKRSSYFLLFIGAIFVGYYSVEKAEKEIRTMLGLIGLTFSIAAYLANRGSKFWAANWEKHCDALSDLCCFQESSQKKPSIGPLFLLNYRCGAWWSPLTPYPFSVTKNNLLLNLYIIVIWTILTVHNVSDLPWGISATSATVTATVVFLFSLLVFTKTSFSDYEIDFNKRCLKI